MNKAVSDCLNKESFTKEDTKRVKSFASQVFSMNPKFYKCPLCQKYHMTSKGAKRGR